MSRHIIYVACFECKTIETIYTGSIVLDSFDDCDWEGEFIYTKCVDCKKEGEQA